MKITDEQKPIALAALFNASKQQGMGFMHNRGDEMSPEEAAHLLTEETYFDYLRGVVMKMDFYDNELDFRLYDRDNGQGAGERAVRSALS